MRSAYPYLEILQPDDSLKIQKPNASEGLIILREFLEQQQNKKCITIGRLEDNDIVLPDPQRNVSRKHCCLKLENCDWWLVDEGSSNGTFVRRQNGETEIDARSAEKILLNDRDVILILSKLEQGEPVFWQLKFRDPDRTNQIKKFQSAVALEYSLSQEKLFRVTCGGREEIILNPQERKFIDYMASRNWENNNQPIVCSYEELLKAIWDEPFGRTKSDVTILTWRIRQKIESDPGEPKFLSTVRRRGFLLNVKTCQYLNSEKDGREKLESWEKTSR